MNPWFSPPTKEGPEREARIAVALDHANKWPGRGRGDDAMILGADVKRREHPGCICIVEAVDHVAVDGKKRMIRTFRVASLPRKIERPHVEPAVQRILGARRLRIRPWALP